MFRKSQSTVFVLLMLISISVKSNETVEANNTHVPDDGNREVEVTLKPSEPVRATNALTLPVSNSESRKEGSEEKNSGVNVRSTIEDQGLSKAAQSESQKVNTAPSTETSTAKMSETNSLETGQVLHSIANYRKQADAILEQYQAIINELEKANVVKAKAFEAELGKEKLEASRKEIIPENYDQDAFGRALLLEKIELKNRSVMY